MPEWNGKTWEYKTETYRSDEETPILQRMNQAGAEGWEIFKMVSGEKFYLVWYKRSVDPKPFT